MRLLETDYKSLPDSMESDELAVYFREFLSVYSDKPRTLPVLKQLYELAYRQWDTYEAVDEDIAVKLDKYLKSAINLRSYDIMDIILSIVENLSLKDTFHYIVDQSELVDDSSVHALIEDAQEEYGERIDDVFGDLDDW